MHEAARPMRVASLALALTAAAGVAGASAQEDQGSAAADETTVVAGVAVASPTAESADADADEATNGSGGGILGHASDRRRWIPGLWGMHFFDRQSLELFWTRGGGVQFDGWFGAAFVNSYDALSLTVGLERDWLDARVAGFGIGAGYRIGLLTGYDGQLMKLADKTPVLPYAGLHLWVQKGPIGVDAFYVYRALAFEASIGY
jgi:hypothetical protein